MTIQHDPWEFVDKPQRKLNRKEKRAQARKLMGRRTRRELFGFGEWRKK